MSDIELKPCPFCGGKAVFHADNGIKIVCRECGCGTMDLSDYYIDGYPTGGAVAGVIKKWNNRTPST